MFDDIDRKIISILNEDGRINNNEIAKQLSVSEGTVRNRLKKLTGAGAFKVAGLINPDVVPDKQLVFLGVKVAVSKDLLKITGKISSLDEVHAAYITTGRYDIIIEAWLDLKYGLIKFLSDALASVEGIVSTESFLIMKSFDKWIPENG